MQAMQGMRRRMAGPFPKGWCCDLGAMWLATDAYVGGIKTEKVEATDGVI
jgi:hypothetical protein